MFRLLMLATGTAAAMLAQQPKPFQARSDDHAYLLAALIELMQAGFRPQDLAWAREIADALLARFEDRTGGGVFFTSDDHESLLLRPKPGHDNATPAGNGIAAQALIVLGHWLSQPRYLDSAERTVRAFGRELAARPGGFSSLLIALEGCLEAPAMLLLRGDPAACASWQRSVERHYRPSLHTLNLSQQQDLPGRGRRRRRANRCGHRRASVAAAPAFTVRPTASTSRRASG